MANGQVGLRLLAPLHLARFVTVGNVSGEIVGRGRGTFESAAEIWKKASSPAAVEDPGLSPPGCSVCYILGGLT